MPPNRPTPRLSWALLGAILALSAYLHFTVVNRSTVAIPMVSDAADYFSYAYNLRNSGVYSNALSWSTEPPPGGIKPDSLRTPGYPLFLGLIPGLEASDDYLKRVAVVQAGLAVMSVLLVFLIARRFLHGAWPHVPALATAISPHLANQSSYLLTECLFLFVLLLAISATISAWERRSIGWFFLAGIAWGACALVRPVALFLPFMGLAVSLALRSEAWIRRGLLVLCVGVVVVQAPWWIRNVVTDLDVSQGSLMVQSLHHGSYPGFVHEGNPHSYGWPFRYDPVSERVERDLPSVAQDILRKFQERPWEMTRWYLLGKPGYFLSWGYVQGQDIYVYDTKHSPYGTMPLFTALRTISLWAHWPMMLLGVLAAACTWWRPAWLGLEGNALVAARILAVTVAYAIAFHMVVAPYPRYGIPFRPLLYMLAALGLAAAFQWAVRGRFRKEVSRRPSEG
jgi:4-amino-4-deoxy-L-arabinose transferase-like glycosyltransferase